MFSTQINVSAQKKADLKLASSIEGYYSGFYISKEDRKEFGNFVFKIRQRSN